ncbi:MAG: hypothetical protein IT270_15755 [Saprospiraceae bacterium]|nr:hypothetical protein [Saprospiraceae bacterium]
MENTFGGIGNESGVAVSREQVVPGYFLVYAADEFTGTFYLITQNGDWFELPGVELFVDKNQSVVYTRTPAECGKCRVSDFDIKTQELTTGWSDGEGHPFPKKAGLKATFWWIKDEEWVKW